MRAGGWLTSPSHLARAHAIALAYRDAPVTLDQGALQVLERRIAPARSIGMHVPRNVPSRADQRAPELRGHELFTVPGQVRDIR